MNISKQSNNFNLYKVIPSFITIISLFLGLTAIRYAVDNDLGRAINLILLASVFDLLDGRIARMLNATTKFGGELDSLCDFSTFGVAPALIMYYGCLYQSYPLGWVTVCFFVVANILRLARFNIMNNDKVNKHYSKFFMGVPVPAGALLSLIPFCLNIRFNININPYYFIIYIFFISVLMVSNIPTLSTKKIHFNKFLLPLITAVLFLFVMILIYYTYTTLIVCALIYLLSIPVTLCLFIYNKKNSL